jgi:hypothetical protein
MRETRDFLVRRIEDTWKVSQHQQPYSFRFVGPSEEELLLAEFSSAVLNQIDETRRDGKKTLRPLDDESINECSALRIRLSNAGDVFLAEVRKTLRSSDSALGRLDALCLGSFVTDGIDQGVDESLGTKMDILVRMSKWKEAVSASASAFLADSLAEAGGGTVSSSIDECILDLIGETSTQREGAEEAETKVGDSEAVHTQVLPRKTVFDEVSSHSVQVRFFQTWFNILLFLSPLHFCWRAAWASNLKRLNLLELAFFRFKFDHAVL